MNSVARQAIKMDGRINNIDDRGFYISGGHVWHLYQDGIVRHGVSSKESIGFWEIQEDAENFLREWLLSGRQAEIDTMAERLLVVEAERDEMREEVEMRNKTSRITTELLRQLIKDDLIPEENDAFARAVLALKDSQEEVERLMQKISEAMKEDHPDLKTNILITALNPREYELLSSTTREDITKTCDGSCNSANGVCDCDEK